MIKNTTAWGFDVVWKNTEAFLCIAAYDVAPVTLISLFSAKKNPFFFFF